MGVSFADRPEQADFTQSGEGLVEAIGEGRRLRHVKGRGWHSLRRRFATDLDHLPMKQLMDLGGWRTPASVVRYQKHITEQLRASLKTRPRGVSAS